jgi:hypothetical protein
MKLPRQKPPSQEVKHARQFYCSINVLMQMALLSTVAVIAG